MKIRPSVGRVSPLASADTDAPAGDGAEETPEEIVPDDLREGVIAELTDVLGDAVVDSHIQPGADMWLRVTNDSWAHVADVVRTVGHARYFGFLSAIDWKPSPYGRYLDAEVDTTVAAQSGEAEASEAEPQETGICGGDTRFQVFARFANVRDHWGITIKADTSSDEDPHIASISHIFAGADWHEREAWEMYGITFDGHPHLRNIYLPTGFEGNPLRKDFPLLARIVKPWPGIVDVELMPETDEPEPDEPESDGDS